MSNEEAIISLASYAAVMAGLGAGLDLPRALAHAGVEPADWDRAADHWLAQIDESAASDLGLLVAFDAALLAAKRRFEPTVEPIESDPRSWSHFRRHLVTAVDPIAFLTQHGLSLATYARIEADWANRALADETLAAVLLDHAQARLEACPTLELTPSPLLRSRAARAPEVSESPSPSAPAISPLLEQPDRGAPWLPSPPVPATELRAGQSSPLETTVLSLETPQAPTLPFTAGAAADLKAPAQVRRPSQEPVHERAISPVTAGVLSATNETVDLTALVQHLRGMAKDALPFGAAAKQTTDPRPPQAVPTISAKALAPLDGTGDITTAIQEQIRAMSASPLPFRPSPQPPASTERLTQGHGLPFQSPPSPPPADVDDLPTVYHPSPPTRSPAEPPQQIPTLIDYAQVCAELRIDPARATSIRARYDLVDDSAWIAAHQYWQGKLNSDPALKQQWIERIAQLQASMGKP